LGVLVFVYTTLKVAPATIELGDGDFMASTNIFKEEFP
jgi:hypothetical protein